MLALGRSSLFANGCLNLWLTCLISFFYQFIGVTAKGEQYVNSYNSSCQWDSTIEDNPSVYWINLDKSVLRRQHMENHLNSLKFRNTRIPAVTPRSPSYKITKLQKPCKRNTEKDISAILSHLKAIHTALYDAKSSIRTEHGRNLDTVSGKESGRHKLSDYALIMEDDVQFAFHLNFTALIASAPKNFGILQLSTSNSEALKQLWATFEKQSSLHYTALSSISSSDKVSFYRNYDKDISSSALWTQNHWNSRTHDGKTTLYWSAQAYLINKKVIKPFIDDVVEVSKDGSLSFKIVNSFFVRSCKRTKAFPCILSNCLFADSYIYAGGGPTYVSHIPLFTGAAVGLASDMHQTHVETHKKGFDEIERIVQKVRHGKCALDMAEQDIASLKDKDKDNNGDGFFIPSYIVNAGQCIPIAD
jgi:GR25 family glycosyltransferase involved in LPS biosynthesis